MKKLILTALITLTTLAAFNTETTNTQYSETAIVTEIYNGCATAETASGIEFSFYAEDFMIGDLVNMTLEDIYGTPEIEDDIPLEITYAGTLKMFR